MPRLMPMDDEQVIAIPGPGNFSFSAVRMDKLGASKYSLITLVLDRSRSTEPFESGLLDVAKTVVLACQDKRNPLSENLLFRFLTFNEIVTEVHGFKLATSIDVNDYNALNSDGMTALFDASYDAVSATLSFAETLIAKDYDVNGAIYIVTDGMNNKGTATPHMIKTKIAGALGKETIIESLLTVLVGLHDPAVSWHRETKESLEKFQLDASIDSYINVGDATPSALAKLGNMIVESVSSTSQNINTGVKSQPLGF